MTRLEALFLGGSCLVLGATVGMVYGRATAPTSVVEAKREEKAKATSTANVDAVTGASSATNTAAAAKERVVIRWKRAPAAPPPPGCPPCVEEGERVEERDATATTTGTTRATSATSSAGTLATESEVFERVKVTVAAPAGPRWSLGALLGMDLDGSRLWGVTGSTKLLGPVHLGAWALPPVRAGGVLVEVRW